MEEVDPVAVGRDVELVKFAEEFGCALAPEAGFLFGGFLEDGFEDLDCVNAN